ncbi:putative E3 ubiquitin-protein ligase LIN-1 [Tripterygium wilfordii]|uniref:Putative E3 ubiquitin-protein ligase LIN-1 n=1 Tax=Tripterygium wilfordii TaxID=458696 RepID=A0A7J7CZ82_TRIWF|nr:putative E3 ubiquitin-protein ligase LIN-1 [Tripterygium wilfordii]
MSSVVGWYSEERQGLMMDPIPDSSDLDQFFIESSILYMRPEQPMTPSHEVNRSIPDHVKFGPILPKSAGFSSLLQSQHAAREASRCTCLRLRRMNMNLIMSLLMLIWILRI